jgi:hypothetical protein
MPLDGNIPHDQCRVEVNRPLGEGHAVVEQCGVDMVDDGYTSPNRVTNAEMMSTYRCLLGRRFGLPSPAWAARLGAPLLGCI